MKNKYVNFISDEHLLHCISNLYTAYLSAKNNITKKDFYKNKVDIIKLTFDSKFNDIDEESLIQSEVLRQIDKSINNSIGTFHEQILGGINGFEVGSLSGFDIKAKDNTLFADINVIKLPTKFEELSFQKLANNANLHKQSKCYSVAMYSENSISEKWIISTNESTISHKRVFVISGDRFYYLLTGEKDALNNLTNVLPVAINDYLKLISSMTL